MTQSHAKKIDVTRRGALALLAGAVIPSWSAELDKQNVYSVLSRHELRNQEGKIITADKLRSEHEKKFTTMSFSFQGCGNAYCPWTNQKLATLGEQENVVHYVISIDPMIDAGMTHNQPAGRQADRNAFEAWVRGFGVKGKIEFLYPRNTEEAKAIMVEAGLTTDMSSEPQQHASDITLYVPGGKQLRRKNGANPNEKLDSWIPIIRGETPAISPSNGRRL